MAQRTDILTHADVDRTIERATELLVEAAHPDKIILFGSHARGDTTRYSDLDLLVILPNVSDRAGEMVRLRRTLKRLPIPIDIIVYSTAEVEERGHLRGTMLHHALQEGKTLHATA
jgi:uncharacterized protein